MLISQLLVALEHSKISSGFVFSTMTFQKLEKTLTTNSCISYISSIYINNKTAQ